MALSSGVYSLIGVVVGAVSTGGFQIALARRNEWREARAARRLVAAELIRVMDVLDRVVDGDPDGWPIHEEELQIVQTVPMWARYSDTLAQITRIPWRELEDAYQWMPEFRGRLNRLDSLTELESRLSWF